MRTFSIDTLGCKANQYESQQIRELLEKLGLDHVSTAKSKVDLVVINTCCVTHTASAKSRQSIRKTQKLSSGAVIVVCGCLPSVEIDELNTPSKNIHLIRHRETLATTLGQLINGKTTALDCQGLLQTHQDIVIRTENDFEIKRKSKLTNQPKLAQLTLFKGQTRAFLKIQDGCDGYCSYCIVPKTRPFVHSKTTAAVLQEAQRLVEAGHKEIVLTGIFLGAFGRESVRRKNRLNQQNDNLADLLDKMAEIPNLKRIRLSSLEPGDVTDRLLDVFCRHRNIMPHLHLSLQSGSNAVLKKMCRQYRIDEFKEKVELIKSRLDRAAITTDIIVGFPGETDADFQQTVDLVREVGFAKMHVFGFSRRKGTAAAVMQDTVDNRVIKRRSQILRDLDTELGYKFRQQFIGETATVLVENSNGQPSGRSERYFMVYLEKTRKKFKQNELTKVKLVKNSVNGAIGKEGV